MKSIISLAAICLSLASSTSAFVPVSSYSSGRSALSMSSVEMTPELEAAISEVRSCASSFGDETAHFANGKFEVGSSRAGVANLFLFLSDNTNHH